MRQNEFLTSVAILLTAMTLIALIEHLVPLFARPSTRRGRGTTNLVMSAVTIGLNGLLNGVAAAIVVASSLHGPAWMTQLGLPPLAQFVAGVAVLDFSFGYLAHRAMHQSAILWRVHRVHHCDPFVDVTTTYRNHPIEGVWRFLFVVIPVWTLGISAEAMIAHRLLSALNGLLEHANFRLWQPLDRVLSLLWVTPQMHKIHHSRTQLETDSNYGNILSIYDRVLGTFAPTERAFGVSYGLDDVDPTHSTSLVPLLAMPFRVSEASPSPTVARPIT